jgi:predicted membrane protein
MFCPKCGAESGPTRFCRSCGTNLTIVSDVLDGNAERGLSLGRKTTLNIFQSSSLSNQSDLDGHHAVSIFGSTRIDLTAASLGIGELRLTVISIFGAIEVLVPDDTAVRVTGISVFGGVNVRGRELNKGIIGVNHYETPGYSSATRRLHIDATSIFGGVKIDK